VWRARKPNEPKRSAEIKGLAARARRCACRDRRRGTDLDCSLGRLDVKSMDIWGPLPPLDRRLPVPPGPRRRRRRDSQGRMDRQNDWLTPIG
jgi:hypothetical protein